LQTLKEIAPNITRVAVIADPLVSPVDGYFRSIAAAAVPLGIEPIRAPVHVPNDIERAIADIGAKPHGALIVLPDALLISNRARVIEQAMRYRVPVVYPFRVFVAEGRLLAYGVNTDEQYRRAALYVDQILKGADPAELPVQTPNKYYLSINLKTARALSLDIATTWLDLADEVIK
jgi:putative ABC transport system substrate-binding protein